MINALELTKQVMMSANWPRPTTIDGTTDLSIMKALQAINYTGLLLGRFYRWRWLYKQYIIRTLGEYKAGDADVTLGSTAVTSDSTSTVWTSDYEGALFKANAYAEQYRVASIESPTSMVLEQVFNGTTATDGAYLLAQDHYDLPADYDNELDILQFVNPNNLAMISPSEMDVRKFGPGSTNPISNLSTMTTNDPTHATIRGLGDNDRYILELDSAPKDPIQIVLHYYALITKFTKDTDKWTFPEYVEPVIHDGALHYIRLNAQDDQRAMASMQDFFMGRQELSSMEPMDVMPRLKCDTGRMRRWRRRRRSLSSGNVDWGSAFDRGLR